MKIHTIKGRFEDDPEYVDDLDNLGEGIFRAEDDRMNLIRMPGISPSQIKTAQKSIYHWWHRRSHPEYYRSTAASRVGTLVHQMILEPDEEIEIWTPPELFVYSDGTVGEWNPRKKECREMLAKMQAELGEERVIYKSDELRVLNTAREIFGNVVAEANTNEILYQILFEGETEVCIRWYDEELGTYFKMIADCVWVNDTVAALLDVKTTDKQFMYSRKEIERKIAGDLWHIQMAMGVDGLKRVLGDSRAVTPLILGVETSAPFLAKFIPLGDEAIDIGRREYRKLAGQIIEAKKEGDYPRYESCIQADGVVEYNLPKWYEEL